MNGEKLKKKYFNKNYIKNFTSKKLIDLIILNHLKAIITSPFYKNKLLIINFQLFYLSLK